MKVILLQNIEKLGRKNDIKIVADGYARNFLIPKKMAVLATEADLEELEEFKEAEIQQAEEELSRYQELASQIDGFEVEIPVKMNENGKLFGAITTAKIAESLKKAGFNVEQEQIKLKEPIKEIGEYEIDIEFPHKLEAKIKVVVSTVE